MPLSSVHPANLQCECKRIAPRVKGVASARHRPARARQGGQPEGGPGGDQGGRRIAWEHLVFVGKPHTAELRVTMADGFALIESVTNLSGSADDGQSSG